MPIHDGEKAVEIIKTPSDDHSRKILSATISKALSVEEIRQVHGIPLGSLYRKIHALEAKGLILANPIKTKDGKKAYEYQATLKNAVIRFGSEQVKVRVTPNGI